MYQELTCHGVTFYIKGLDVDLVKEVSEDLIRDAEFRPGDEAKLIGCADKTTVIVPTNGQDEFSMISPFVKVDVWDEISGDFPPRVFDNIDEAESFDKKELALGRTVHKEVNKFSYKRRN